MRRLTPLILLGACAGSGDAGDTGTGITGITSPPAATTGADSGTTTTPTTAPEPDETGATTTTGAPDTTTAPDPDATTSSATTDVTGGDPTRAYLHVDAWSVWWNDRTRCGAERTFQEICQRQGGDCGLYDQAVAACDPNTIVYGQVGPEKQGEALCQRGMHPDIGGCVAADYDFDALRFWWYGAEWQGNWPVATIKLFPQGVDWKGGGEVVAFSNVPGAAQAAMAGIDNHGLGSGCAMPGVTSGDDKYLHPFGGFAWIEVPTATPLTLAVMAASNFGDMPFAGCNRGMATQDPWITAAPGATLGCVHVAEDVVFTAGKHYMWRYGQLAELPEPAPPPELVAGFALPAVGLDVTSIDACKP